MAKIIIFLIPCKSKSDFFLTFLCQVGRCSTQTAPIRIFIDRKLFSQKVLRDLDIFCNFAEK
jgi:hypothetical protein